MSIPDIQNSVIVVSANSHCTVNVVPSMIQVYTCMSN